MTKRRLALLWLLATVDCSRSTTPTTSPTRSDAATTRATAANDGGTNTEARPAPTRQQLAERAVEAALAGSQYVSQSLDDFAAERDGGVTTPGGCRRVGVGVVTLEHSSREIRNGGSVHSVELAGSPLRSPVTVCSGSDPFSLEATLSELGLRFSCEDATGSARGLIFLRSQELCVGRHLNGEWGETAGVSRRDAGSNREVRCVPIPRCVQVELRAPRRNISPLDHTS